MLTIRPSGQTQASTGTIIATAPGAGAAIASITGLTPGTYVVFVVAGYGAGTAPAAAENANMECRLNASSKGKLAVPGAITVVPFTFIIDVAATTDTISVNAVGAGSAGVVYIAQLMAFRG